jgi:hypothetical protein
MLSCLSASADGSLVVWQDRKRTIRAGSLQDAAKAPSVGSARSCPAAGAAANGGAALAAETGDMADTLGLQLALRPAARAFSALAPVALPVGLSCDGAGLALGGGVVAMGASRQQGGRALPAPGDPRRRWLGAIGAAAGWRRQRKNKRGARRPACCTGRKRPRIGHLRRHHKAGGQLLAARLDATGVLQGPQVLADGGVHDTLTDPSLAAGTDGSAAIAWVSGTQAMVVTETTAAGFGVNSAARTPVHWVVAVDPRRSGGG